MLYIYFMFIVFSVASNRLVYIENCKFIDNKSFTAAGVMYLFNSGAVIIKNSHFEGNSA